MNYKAKLTLALPPAGLPGLLIVLLISLLALERKFIILDLKETTPNELLGLAAVTLALGVTYCLLRERDDRLGLQNERATGEGIRFKASEVFPHSHTLIQTTKAQLL